MIWPDEKIILTVRLYGYNEERKMLLLIVMVVGMFGLAIASSGGCLGKFIGWGIVLIDVLIFAALNGRL